MAARTIRKVLATGVMLGFAHGSSALMISNPAPAAFGPDIAGSGIFTPQNTFFQANEILDLAAVLGFAGSEFGFFFESTPGTLIPLFEAADENPDPGGAGDVPQNAAVNLDTGQVLDGDDGFTEQGTFSTVAGDGIGFYLSLTAPELTPVFGAAPIYSVGTLNPGSEDQFAAFPVLTDPSSFLVSFAAEDPSTGSTTVLGYSVVTQLDSVADVPVPAPLGLILLPLSALLLARRSQMRRG